MASQPSRCMSTCLPDPCNLCRPAEVNAADWSNFWLEQAGRADATHEAALQAMDPWAQVGVAGATSHHPSSVAAAVASSTELTPAASLAASTMQLTGFTPPASSAACTIALTGFTPAASSAASTIELAAEGSSTPSWAATYGHPSNQLTSHHPSSMAAAVTSVTGFTPPASSAASTIELAAEGSSASSWAATYGHPSNQLTSRHPSSAAAAVATYTDFTPPASSAASTVELAADGSSTSIWTATYGHPSNQLTSHHPSSMAAAVTSVNGFTPPASSAASTVELAAAGSCTPSWTTTYGHPSDQRTAHPWATCHHPSSAAAAVASITGFTHPASSAASTIELAADGSSASSWAATNGSLSDQRNADSDASAASDRHGPMSLCASEPESNPISLAGLLHQVARARHGRSKTPSATSSAEALAEADAAASVRGLSDRRIQSHNGSSSSASSRTPASTTATHDVLQFSMSPDGDYSNVQSSACKTDASTTRLGANIQFYLNLFADTDEALYRSPAAQEAAQASNGPMSVLDILRGLDGSTHQDRHCNVQLHNHSTPPRPTSQDYNLFKSGLQDMIAGSPTSVLNGPAGLHPASVSSPDSPVIDPLAPQPMAGTPMSLQNLSADNVVSFLPAIPQSGSSNCSQSKEAGNSCCIASSPEPTSVAAEAAAISRTSSATALGRPDDPQDSSIVSHPITLTNDCDCNAQHNKSSVLCSCTKLQWDVPCHAIDIDDELDEANN